MCAVVEMTTVFGGEEWRKRERREPAGEQIRGSSTQKKNDGEGESNRGDGLRGEIPRRSDGN